MALSVTAFGKLADHLAQKRVDFDSDTFKLMLVNSTYTPDLDNHDYKNDITNEITGTGYTAGGVTLGSVTWTYNSTDNKWVLDAADASWSSATFSGARRGIIYDDTPATDATKPLIAVVDFDGDQAVTANTFTVVWNAGGILEFDA